MGLSAVMNIHMQTSKLDSLCISVSIVHALSMTLHVLTTVEIQKLFYLLPGVKKNLDNVVFCFRFSIPFFFLPNVG